MVARHHPGVSTRARVRAGDSTIRDSVMARLRTRSWRGPWPLNVIVHHGTVELWGLVASPDEKTAVRLIAEETDGVRAVNDHLLVRPSLMDIDYVIPLHCSGEPFYEISRVEMPATLLRSYTGTRFVFGGMGA
jgi:hypothetical protein